MDSRTKYPAAEILIEFLEVAIHHIIYVRQIYPATIFACKRKYGVPIKISMHPQINFYISECLKYVQVLLKRNELHKVSIILLDEKSIPLENFIFDIINLHSSLHSKDPYLIICEEKLRSFFWGLGVNCALLKPIPTGTSFQIQVTTTEHAHVSISEDSKFKDFPWVGMAVTSSESKKSNIVPFATLDIEFLQVQIYIEQT